MRFTTAIVESPSEEDRAAILAPLSQYNQRAGHPYVARPIAILLKDEHDRAVGGLWGWIIYNWVQIELLAVPENLRGNGYGMALIAKAEELGRAHGCQGAWLDTFAFQARGFYERIG